MNTMLNRKFRWGECAMACALLLTSFTYAADEPAATNTSAHPTNTSATHAIATPTKPKLHLKLSAHELDSIIANHRTTMIASNSSESELEEVVVTAPTELLPMRSPTRDIWGGLAAPFWAIAHPTQAWRIFLPIPPE
jgi:hypothetical protein